MQFQLDMTQNSSKGLPYVLYDKNVNTSFLYAPTGS